ncbi:hypothetical protein DSL72_001803 [Monilinia vaccinii-corymbosi]|uniref:Uncharacterized protein n=1 Tax=Monilinia vaccinii-corymbosi TaxID=61207 RepID=A0A8A3PAU6_9HELO|nr:hypothetical protein DSL72_001803 [Monilinia vaccinii-corymbosi]
MRRKLLAVESLQNCLYSNRSAKVVIIFEKMTRKDSGPRGDIRRDRTRSQTSKNQYQSSQPSNNSPSDLVRSTLRNTHGKSSNDQNNPQPLNPQTLHEHTTNEAQLSKDPYYAHIIRQNETRKSIKVKHIPRYQHKASTPTQAYSTQYLTPEITISDIELPADDDHTWAKTRDEYLSNGQDVMNPSSDLNGIGGQFPELGMQGSRAYGFGGGKRWELGDRRQPVSFFERHVGTIIGAGAFLWNVI